MDRGDQRRTLCAIDEPDLFKIKAEWLTQSGRRTDEGFYQRERERGGGGGRAVSKRDRECM